MAFAAERRPVLHDIAKFEKEEDEGIGAAQPRGNTYRVGNARGGRRALNHGINPHARGPLPYTHAREGAGEARKVRRGVHRCAAGGKGAAGLDRRRIHLGNIEGKLGRWKEAAIHWNEALILQPHNPNLRRDLERASVEMTAEVHKPSKQAQHTEPPLPSLTSPHTPLMPLPPHTGGGGV